MPPKPAGKAAVKKKPVIEYPPVPTKKWIPPDQRPKPPKPPPAYIKPQGMNQHLKISSLLKIWNRFTLFKNRYVLAGTFSQTSKKFRLKTNGLQGSSNVIVAAIMANIVKMEKWTVETVNQVLTAGDLLYEKSIAKSSDKSLRAIEVSQVYPSFYLSRYIITYQIPNVLEPMRIGIVGVKPDPVEVVEEHLTGFFAKGHDYGVIKSDQRHLSFWRYDSAYFLFDPTDHTKSGDKWMGLLGTGYAFCARFPKLKSMVEYLVAELTKGKSLKMNIWPVEVLRCDEINVKPPENLEDVMRANQEEKRAMEEGEMGQDEAGSKKIPMVKKQAMQSAKKPDTVQQTEEELMLEEQASDSQMTGRAAKPTLSKSKLPMQPRTTNKNITHYTIINKDAMGIIRATTHQTDKKFSRFKDGEQSLSQAVAALVMRRQYPVTRQWIRKFINEILKLGETIHHQSIKGRPDGPFNLDALAKKIEHADKKYQLNYEELAFLGRLESEKQDVLDLFPALVTFLRTYDCCVINGPWILAVWYDDNRYYMYDPNERDGRGRVIDKTKKNQEPGVACVTWFTSLKDLVKLYMENVPKGQRRVDFHLSKVIVDDFVGIPDKWNNFTGLAKGKWILRGTISQNSRIFTEESRNTQCTANACMSIAFCHIREPKEWSTNTVDQVLKSGNEFYLNTTRRLSEAGKLVSRLLMVDELDRNFSFSQKEIKFDIMDCVVNGILGYPDNGDVPNIKTGLRMFFGDYDFGVLTSRSISVAVWKKDGVYYYFDSHCRDDKGVVSFYGTACLIRALTIEDLAKSIEANLPPDKVSLFNFGSVKVSILDANEEGGDVKFPLNNYQNVPNSETVAILSATTSNMDDKYDFNAGKQAAPQSVAALGMNRLRPSSTWTKKDLQTILDVGHKYFEDCMAAYESSTEEVEEDKGITAQQLTKEFKIGMNKIEINLESIGEGFVEDGLEGALTNYYGYTENFSQDDRLEVLVETEDITVSTWTDENLFYLFDPMARDDQGQAIGKSSWAAKIKVEAPDTTAPTSTTPVAASAEGGAGDVVSELRPKSAGEGVFEKDPVPQKNVALAAGKACTLFFYHLEDMIQHIIENTRPAMRSMMPFTVNKVTVKNTPIVKEIYNKDYGERIDSYSGNWHNFVELDHGHWILRGQVDLSNKMFPQTNRNKQHDPAILSSLCFAKLYSMQMMKPELITSILCYGDRLLTHMKRVRKEAMTKDKTLDWLPYEIDVIVEKETYKIDQFPKTFVIGDYKLNMTLLRDLIKGEVTAGDEMEVLNLKRGLNELFSKNMYGIIDCKGYRVGVWKGATVYYMFDPHITGVTGSKAPIGYPSISRYLKTEKLAETFLLNIPKEGLNTFTIRRVNVMEERHNRAEDLYETSKAQKPLKISGYTEVMPGMSILRGTYSQDHPRFGKGERGLDAPAAVVALTMSLIHKPETWSKPIIDEVLTVADELHTQTITTARPGFNPWEEAVDPFNVAKDFKVGVMHANMEYRPVGEGGILETKNPKYTNLRQGLEQFFLEHTHGILYSPPLLCLAIWEEQHVGYPILYLYDPNRRGPNGQPSVHGTSCVVTFASAKGMAEHVLACIKDPEDRQQEFTILPVEMTVGPYKTAKKKSPAKKEATKKKQDGSTMMQKLAHQTTLEEKRTLRKKMAEQKKKLDEKQKYWERRNGYFDVPIGQAILRGTRHLESLCYQDKNRGNQDIPVCVVSFVANCIVPIGDWTWREIDAILDTGDQLYIDSYIAYGPRDKKLGLKNVVRNIYMMNKKAHVTIYKPITLKGFKTDQLRRMLEKWFLDQPFCMLNYEDNWVSVFFKKGRYYYFDPHGRGPSGCCSGDDMAACVLRFDNTEDLAAKLINNMKAISKQPPQSKEEEVEEEDEEKDLYVLVLVRLEGGICVCEKKPEK